MDRKKLGDTFLGASGSGKATITDPEKQEIFLIFLVFSSSNCSK